MLPVTTTGSPGKTLPGWVVQPEHRQVLVLDGSPKRPTMPPESFKASISPKPPSRPGGQHQRAVDNLRILEVCLDGANGDVVIEERKHVIQACAAGDSPAPLERLVYRTVDAAPAAERMDERNEAAERPADYGAAFNGVDLRIVRIAAAAGRVQGKTAPGSVEVSAFDLHADVAVEVAGDARRGVEVVDVLVLIAVDAAVDGVEIAVAAARRRRANRGSPSRVGIACAEARRAATERKRARESISRLGLGGTTSGHSSTTAGSRQNGAVGNFGQFTVIVPVHRIILRRLCDRSRSTVR